MFFEGVFHTKHSLSTDAVLVFNQTATQFGGCLSGSQSPALRCERRRNPKKTEFKIRPLLQPNLEIRFFGGWGTPSEPEAPDELGFNAE